MNNLFKLKALLVLFCLLTSFVLKAQKQPNIIFILTDDMGYGDLSCYDGEQVPTPNIDKMAEEGIKFTHYYSAAPICSPSRAGISTGMFPANWNFTTFLNDRKSNARAEQANYLNTNAPSIGRLMKKAGYVTGHFGKWHMGGGRDIKNAPKFKAYGYDEWSSTYESPQPDPALTASDWIWSKKDSVKRWNRTEYFVNKTLDFLKRHKDKPCYVNLWSDDMHDPWVPEVTFDYIGQFPMNPKEEKAFNLVLKEFDIQIGRLIDGIKKLGIEDNTLIVFTSDNGPLPTFRGSRAAGLRGSKLSLYEGGIRMPFIVKWKGHTPEGVVDSTSVLNGTDLFPTFAKIASAQLPTNYKGDGECVEDAFIGAKHNRVKDMYWEYGRNNYAFNYPTVDDKSPNLAIRSGKWKLLCQYNSNIVELYDMENDPYETTNLSQKFPEITKELKVKLVTWRKYLPELTPERANP